MTFKVHNFDLLKISFLITFSNIFPHVYIVLYSCIQIKYKIIYYGFKPFNILCTIFSYFRIVFPDFSFYLTIKIILDHCTMTPTNNG